MEKGLLLEGESVRLEPLSAHHLPALRECANDPALWEFTFGKNPSRMIATRVTGLRGRSKRTMKCRLR